MSDQKTAVGIVVSSLVAHDKLLRMRAEIEKAVLDAVTFATHPPFIVRDRDDGGAALANALLEARLRGST